MPKVGFAKNIRTVLEVIGNTEKVEIIWPPNSQSERHDHGRSYGTTLVIEGEIYEIRGECTRIYRAGQTFTEEPHTIHIVGSARGAKTHHTYTPPITGTMRIYPKE